MKKIAPIIIASIKTRSQRGKWVYKPLRSTIVVCTCGNKYIVTRKQQIQCLDCIYGKTFK